MPRRLIIGILIVLILGIVGGTIALIVQRLRGTAGTPTGTPSTGTLTPADTGPQQVANPTADDDGDGLTNAEEIVWGTVVDNADTDGDGYKDGEEVAANHNPTIPAPNDLLPADFRPGQNLQSLPEAPPQVDQFFVENLNLKINDTNLTEAYHRQYSEDQRTQENLVAFAKQQPIITSLPAVKPNTIRTTQSTSPLTLGHYLDTAGDLDVLIDRTVIAEIYTDLFNRNDPSTAFGQSAMVRLHQQDLLALSVPPDAVTLQKLLLGFTELLAVTYEQMGLWNEDPVKAMVAINQLDEIDRKYFPLIRSEVDRLKNLQASLEGATQ